jgi:hypothetical protein
MIFTLNEFGGHGRPPRNRNLNPSRPPEFLAFFILALTICTTTLAQLTLSTSSLPLTVTLPPLNTTTQAYDLSITSPSSLITSLYLTLSICSVGSNTSIIPAILVSLDPENFDIDQNSVSDRTSGGVDKANRKARGAAVWALAWDRGFANWTYADDDGVESVLMRLEFAEGEEVSEGNVVIQLGASLDGTSALSTVDLLAKLIFRTSTSCLDLNAVPWRYDFHPVSSILTIIIGLATISTDLSELYLTTSIDDTALITRIQFPTIRPDCRAYRFITHR